MTLWSSCEDQPTRTQEKSPMIPTEVLKEEHRVIETVLTCLEQICHDAVQTGKLDQVSAKEATSFFREFADHCHHGKEEELLFPMLEEKGFSKDEGPTAVMRQEHETGRQFVRSMLAELDGAAAGEAEALKDFTEAGLRFVDHLREHIQKEDGCLFSMADGILSAADQEALLQEFQKAETKLGPDVHQTYLGVAERLAKRFHVTGEAIKEAQSHGCCGHSHP